MIPPFPVKSPPLEGIPALLVYIWSQWFTGVRAALNQTPGNSQPVAFASLPAPVEGMLLTITDSTVNTWGSIIAGGGAHRVLGYYNGAHWTVAAV